MIQGKRTARIKRLEAVLYVCVAFYILYTLTGQIALPLSLFKKINGNLSEVEKSKMESDSKVTKKFPREIIDSWKGQIHRELGVGTKGESFISVIKLFRTAHTFWPHVQNHYKKLKKLHIRGIKSDFRTSQTTKINDTEKMKENHCQITFDLEPCSCRRTLRTPFPSACPETITSAEETLQIMKKAFGDSTCGDWATIRGPKQKVVSYSLYGDIPSDYYQGLEFLVPRVADVYPGWTVRIYHRLDESNPAVRSWMCWLACKYPHLDYCNVGKTTGLGKMSGDSGQGWRFAVMGDELVDLFLVRDADSPILQREVDAVSEWLSSSSCFHIMRDNIFHRVPIMAGMWGGCNTWKERQLRIIRDQMLQDVGSGIDDQTTLKNELWPLAQRNATIHDSYTCKRFSGSQPFPSQRINFTFVGQRTYRKQYLKERTVMQCPWKCRPKKHPEWIYC